MEKITDILSATVITETGKHLGRVLELRSQGEPEHGSSTDDREITELICGRRGLLELVGLRKAVVKQVPWHAVKRIDGRTIVVAD